MRVSLSLTMILAVVRAAAAPDRRASGGRIQEERQ
jgi:hypothetical protein